MIISVYLMTSVVGDHWTIWPGALSYVAECLCNPRTIQQVSALDVQDSGDGPCGVGSASPVNS